MSAVVDILRRAAGLPPLEQRAAGEWGSSAIPTWSSHGTSSSGIPVSPDVAFGLSAAAQAIRQPSVLAAGLPLDVYDVSQDRKTRTLSRGKWQNELLDQPDKERSGFDFWSDLHSHVNGFNNAYSLKLRDGGRVFALLLLDPERIHVEADPRTRVRTYCFWREDGVKVEIPGANILHVRGWDPRGGACARSPVERHRDEIGRIAGRTRFAEKFLANDARPGTIIKMPEKVTRAQAADFLELWNEDLRGSPGKAKVIGGGGDIITLPVSLRDAQFIEGESIAVADLARIFDWSADLIGAALGNAETARPFVEVMAWAVRIHLMPRLQRVESAFGDDPDFFGSSSKYRPYHDVSELLRGDAATMANVFHQLRQVGVITANEARVPLGFPPIDGGDELQATPVGGAPNAAAPAPDAPAAPEPPDPTEAPTEAP